MRKSLDFGESSKTKTTYKGQNIKNTIKKIGLSALLAATLLTSSHAGSVGGFGGSLEVTQWGRFGAETVDRASAYAKQLEEYALQAQQYQQQIDQKGVVN